MKNVIIPFIAGLAVGAITVWHYVKRSYDERLNEAIKELDESRFETTVFEVEEPETKNENENENDDEIPEKTENEYEKISSEYTHSFCPHRRPYVISPDDIELAEDVTTYVLYADGVLVDDYNEPIDEEDIDEIVGIKNLDMFGTTEAGPDELYIRNEKLNMDISIIRSLERWKKEVK